ncbi:MAG TPA: hypothetical protein VGM88_04240 [Kofleriaceae bacterium]
MTTAVDPTTGLAAVPGSVALRTDHGALYSKTGPLSTDWSLLEISPSALAAIASSGSASDLGGSLSSFYLPAYTGDVTTSAGNTVTTIGATKVTDVMLRDSAATSVIGNASAATANAADIQATADGQALMRTGSTLQFMTPPTLTLDPNVQGIANLATGTYHDYVIPSDPIVLLHITSLAGTGDWVFGGFTPAMDHQILIVACAGSLKNASPYCYLKMSDSGSTYQITRNSNTLANRTVTGVAAVLIYDASFTKWYVING